MNPGVIAGGTRSNVVAAEARADVDIRIARLKDAPGARQEIPRAAPVRQALFHSCGGRLESSADGAHARHSKLVSERARVARVELGVKLEESSTGGGSDGNFTAALGIPTLDGLGGVGEGAHAANESILVDRIADRTALLAMLLSRL